MDLIINELIEKADVFNNMSRLEVEARDATDEMRERARVHLNTMAKKCNDAAEKGKYFADVMKMTYDEIPSGSHPITKVPGYEQLRGAAAIVSLDAGDFFPFTEVIGTHDNIEETYYLRVHWKTT